MKKEIETKIVNGVKWMRYEGDSFWQLGDAK